MNSTQRTSLVSDTMKLVVKIKKQLMKANRECPECTGTNLNESLTLCWDCSTTDSLGE
jgi:ribosomal protein L37AE/L43A